MSAYANTTVLKANARESLLGHLGVSVSSVLLYSLSVVTLSSLISALQSANPLISLLFSAVTLVVLDTCGGLLEVGLCMQFLRYHYGKDAHIGDLFAAFRFNSNTCVAVRFALALMDLACMMPALVAAHLTAEGNTASYIIFYALMGAGLCAMFYLRLEFALTPYMLLDFPQLTDRQILRAGHKMMQGHKARLFRLYLSFVPLLFLGLISFGIANLWVDSYLHASIAAFYKDRMQQA